MMSATLVQVAVARCAPHMSRGRQRRGHVVLTANYSPSDELETLGCQLPTQWHRALTRLQAETTPKELGAKNWKDVLRIRGRITATEANRRLAEAASAGPRRTLTGEPLARSAETDTAAIHAETFNNCIVDEIRRRSGRDPRWVDTATREQIEVQLVGIAAGVGPTELKKTADDVLFLLDQDGPEPDDTERHRKRGLTLRSPATRRHGASSRQPRPRSVGDL